MPYWWTISGDPHRIAYGDHVEISCQMVESCAFFGPMPKCLRCTTIYGHEIESVNSSHAAGTNVLPKKIESLEIHFRHVRTPIAPTIDNMISFTGIKQQRNQRNPLRMNILAAAHGMRTTEMYKQCRNNFCSILARPNFRLYRIMCVNK